jgi:hypothetical protein
MWGKVQDSVRIVYLLFPFLFFRFDVYVCEQTLKSVQ